MNPIKLTLFRLSELLKISVVNHKKKWEENLPEEVGWWERFITTGKDFADRLNPNLPLQDFITSLLPKDQKHVQILDVGAGPLTIVGKKYLDYDIDLTAVDPLANEYDKLILKYGVNPPIKTGKVDAERLTEVFAENTFDLAYARNCLDHSYDPEKAIVEMIKVTKPGRYILLEHTANEGEHQSYSGLHQWNFSCRDNDFMIGSPNGKINFTRKHKEICSVSCTFNEAFSWLVTKIQQK
jgi:SAM-dependent methyltransferase